MVKILFLCTGNSCRSQMAEGWAHALKSDCIEPYSAGIEKHGLNPYAIKVMAEAGVDISAQYSKLLSELDGIEFDYVVTVCGNAHESCPVFLGKTKVIHIGFDDPPRLAANCQTEDKKRDCYRRVRDEIKAFVETLPVAIIGFIVLAKVAPKGRCGSSCNSSFPVPVMEKTENVAVPKGNATNKTMEEIK